METQLQQEGIFLIRDCAIDPTILATDRWVGRTTLEVGLPPESLPTFCEGDTCDVIILKYGVPLSPRL